MTTATLLGLLLAVAATDGARVAGPPTRKAPERRGIHSVGTETPIYWAWCRSDNKAVLIASSTPTGVATAAEQDLENLATELGGVTWYRVPTAGAERAAGPRFETPTVTQEDALRFLELGGCATPGVIYSTAPVAEPELPTPAYGEQTMRAMRRTARARVGRKVSAIEASAAPDGQVGLRLCRVEHDGSCFGWMLLDAKRRPRRVTAPAEPASWLWLREPQTDVRDARWLRPRGGPRYWVGLIPWEASSSECDGETCGALVQDGLWLVWMRGTRVQAVKVVVKELAA